MPELIRTPEQIFREEGQDIYFIRFSERNSPAEKELLRWFSKNTPDVRTEKLGPSEYSGVIEGYFGDVRIICSESDLAKFSLRWESSDGESLDPRFQCLLDPYQVWLDKVSTFSMTNKRPQRLGLTAWWETPKGFFYHQISLRAATKAKLTRHPGNPKDMWFNAARCWLDLATLDLENLVYGDIFKAPDGCWKVIFVDGGSSRSKDFFKHRQQDLIKWFGLPADIEITEFRW